MKTAGTAVPLPSCRRGARRARGDVLGPAIVGLAARRTHDRVDVVELARELVARDLRAAMGLDRLERRPGAGARLHDRRDPLAPRLVRDADDDAVVHLRVALHRAL